MAIQIDLDRAIFKWQLEHNERMTYSDLSRLADISLPTLYRIRSGETSRLSLDKLDRICDALECDISDILYRTKSEPEKAPVEAKASRKATRKS